MHDGCARSRNWAVSGVLGPLAGAVIVAHLSWAWIFWMNVPIGLASAAGFIAIGVCAGTVGYYIAESIPPVAQIGMVFLAPVYFVVFLIVITPIFHNFWDVPAAQAQMQQINFMKNIAIMGGMFMVAAFGPGRFSIDRA